MGTLNDINLKKDYENREFLDFIRWNADQAAIETAINKFISSILDGDSGADNLSMTAITEISDTTKVQTFLEALVTLLLSQVTNDYNKLGLTKVLAKYDGTGGSEIIGSQPSGGLVGTTVHAQLLNLKTAIDQLVEGQIPIGTIDSTKLTTVINVILNSVGDASTLSTTAKDTLVAAINEVFSNTGVIANLLTQNKTSLVGAINEHINDKVNHVPYGVTTGTANTYALILAPAPTAYVDGMAISVKINVDGSAASTINVNDLGAIPIKKANGTDVTNLNANGVYTLRYNSTTGNFILQGEGGSGDATASDLLSGKTAVTDAGDIVGTMPDKTGSGTAITPSGIDQAIPQGYYDGSVSSGKVSGRTVSAGDTILLASLSETFMYDNGNMTKRKEIAISASGIIRVKFDLRTDAMGYTANGRIYVNGIAVGTLRTMTNQNYATYTEDIACNNNDLIQIYMCSAGSHSAYVRNFEICVSSNQYGTVNM